MVNNNSSTKNEPTQKEYEVLASTSKFTDKEIKILWNGFKTLNANLAKDQKNLASTLDKILGIKSKAFCERILSAFTSKPNFELTFADFVRGLSAISPKASIEEKAKFCFQVFDSNKDGFIDKIDIGHLIMFGLSENQSLQLSGPQVDAIMNFTFEKMDKDKDNNISFDEFLKEAQQNPSILNFVHLSIEGLFE